MYNPIYLDNGRLGQIRIDEEAVAALEESQRPVRLNRRLKVHP